MKILLEGIVGSTAYGLATATSDVDKLGVMQLPTEAFLDLYDGPSERELSKVTTEPDVTYHDVGKFCRLALGCNPTVMELLWIPDELYTQSTRSGQELVWLREYFLSADRVRDAYMGYAQSQAIKSSSATGIDNHQHRRAEKHARHLLRLMHQGYILYTEGWLPVKLDDPDRFHDFGKRASRDHDYMNDTMLEYKRKFAEAKTVLPDKPDTEEISEWVLGLRMRSL